MSTEAGCLSLLHLCDSLFPTGGFAHSDGLETATASGQVSTASDLRGWIEVYFDESLARTDGPAVWLAVDARVRGRWSDLDRLDAELHALRPSSTARAANRAIGGRLLKSWQGIYPNVCVTDPAHSGSNRIPPVFCLPIAFGIVCGSIDVEPRTAVSAFVYTRLASLVSSAMRLMSIGQRDSHSLLAAALARVPSVVDGIDDRIARGVRPGAFAPALDIAAIGQQYVHSRLFLS